MGSKRKRSGKEPVALSQPTTKRSKKSLDAASGSKANGSKAAPRKLSKNLDKSPFSDRPTIEERKREAHLYDLLGSEDSDDRINAADAIVSGLLAGDGVPQSVLLRHLDKRLFRGLASGRNASRIGFSLVITEILRQLFGEDDLASSRYSGLAFDKVLSILVERTHAGGNVPGQEERDHYFGQLFGIECYVSAGILFRDKARWLSVVDLILRLAHKKVWLRSQCGWIIIQAMQQMKQKLAEKTLQKLSDEALAKTPEGVGIWIVALDRFPDINAPSKPWRNPLSPKAYGELPAVLKDSGREASNGEQAPGRRQKQNNWTAQLHFVWDLILAHFAKSPANSDVAENFKLFWNRVVDEGFFSRSSSDSQKFSGFMIFQKMLEGGSNVPFMVDSVFSQNLMACLMNQASREDRYLHRAALKALRAVEAAVQGNPPILVPVLRQLLAGHGVYNFDQRTNTKTVERLLQSAAPSNIDQVLATVKELNNLERPQSLQTYGNYISKLASISTESASSDGEDGASVPAAGLRELAKIAYSTSDEFASDEKIQAMLRGRLTSAFAKSVRRPEDFAHLCNAVLLIEVDMAMDEEIQAALVGALERLRVLLDSESVSQELRGPYHALALLHAVGVLQLYNEDPDALETLADLEQCYDKLTGNDAGGEGGISEFLIDILLPMISRPSSLMRQVSQQVFEVFTPALSAQAIQQLIEPLLAEENAKGQQALFSTEDEDMDADEGSESGGSDHESLDSDVEIMDVEDAPSDLASSSSSADNEDDDDEEEEEEEEEEEDDDDEEEDGGSSDQDKAKGGAKADGDDGAQDDHALAKILNSHPLDQDADASDGDSDSDMSDSAMLALDPKLEEIFKHRAKAQSRKKENKDARATVVNLKHRVLDLLAIFVRREAAAANPLVFHLLLPLLRLIRTTAAKALAAKACDVVVALSRGRRKPSAPPPRGGVDGGDGDEDLLALLRDLHAEAARDPAHVFARAASAASLAVAAVLCAPAAGRAAEVFRLYADTQLAWFRGELRMQPSFFSDWLNWCQSHALNAAAAAQGKEE